MSEPKNRSASIVFGLVLILAGLAFLLVQVFHVGSGVLGFGWPLFVLLPGLLLFLVVRRGSEFAEPAAILGGILTITGLVLLYQNITGHWASWAYAWALIAPGGVALGEWVYGTLHNKAASRESARSLAGVSLSMFLIAGLFFELVLNISGFTRGLGGLGLPIVLIVLGVLLFARSLLGDGRWRRRASARKYAAPEASHEEIKQ